ncbi:hypothetical protein BH10BAC4_BH10BAC4_16550 [soil metagenome]
MSQFIEEIDVAKQTRQLRISENNSYIHWLNEGANYFGKGASNNIIYPGQEAAMFSGILFLNRDRVLIRVAAGERIMHKKKSIDNILIYERNTSLVLEYGSFKFQVINEQGRYGLLFFL